MRRPSTGPLHPAPAAPDAGQKHFCPPKAFLRSRIYWFPTVHRLRKHQRPIPIAHQPTELCQLPFTYHTTPPRVRTDPSVLPHRLLVSSDCCHVWRGTELCIRTIHAFLPDDPLHHHVALIMHIIHLEPFHYSYPRARTPI